MNESVRNALYRNYGGRHNVNMNALNNYYSGRPLSANRLRGLITSLEKYRDRYNPSQSVKKFIRNMKDELGADPYFRPKISRENILRAKSRLRRRFPEGTALKFSSRNIPGHITTGRRVQFTAENLQAQKARLKKTSSSPPRPRSLAATALFQVMGQVSPSRLPPGLMTAALRGKGRVTPANVRVSKTNLKMVREFKNYVNLVKRAREFASSSNSVNANIEQAFQRNLNSYRTKFKLEGKKNAQLLYKTVLLATKSDIPLRTPFYIQLRKEYKKYGFFKASTIAKILRTIKKTAKRPPAWMLSARSML